MTTVYTTNATAPSHFRLVFNAIYAGVNKKDQPAVLCANYINKSAAQRGHDASRHMATLHVQPNGTGAFLAGGVSYAYADGEVYLGMRKTTEAKDLLMDVHVNFPADVAEAIYKAAVSIATTRKSSAVNSELSYVSSEYQLILDIDDTGYDSFKQLQSNDKLDFHIKWEHVRAVAVVTKGHEWYVTAPTGGNVIAEMSGRDVIKAMFSKAGTPAANVPRIESANVKAHLLARKTVGTSIIKPAAAITVTTQSIDAGIDPAEIF